MVCDSPCSSRLARPVAAHGDVLLSRAPGRCTRCPACARHGRGLADAALAGARGRCRPHAARRYSRLRAGGRGSTSSTGTSPRSRPIRQPTCRHRVQLLQDGTLTYQAMFTAIAAARDTSHGDYILEDDGDRPRFAELIGGNAPACSQLISDGVGHARTPTAFFDRLRDAGIQV